MPTKDYQNEERASQQQASQEQTRQQSQQPVAAGQAPDTSKLLDTLTQVFATLQSQLQNQAPKPFDGDAKVAVDKFNDIVLTLQLKFLPEPPTNLEIKPVSPTEIELRWTDGPFDTNNADGFKIFRCQGSNCQDFEEIKPPLLSNTRAYKDNNLSSGTVYRYRLKAFNSRGESAFSQIAEGRTESQ